MDQDTLLFPLEDLLQERNIPQEKAPDYFYEGTCPATGDLKRLPRTALAEAAAQGLMAQLQRDEIFSREGKMYGILLVSHEDGEIGVLKAFSGQLQGQDRVEGWVPPLPGHEQIALAEAYTVRKLDDYKQDIIDLHYLPLREEYAQRKQEYEAQWTAMKTLHSQHKEEREQRRQELQQSLEGDELATAMRLLDRESYLESRERQEFKQQREQTLGPLVSQIKEADQRILELKRERKALSRSLQVQMHMAYRLTNFAGVDISLETLMEAGRLPTGTGDCAAPKLLHYAATHGLQPIALAEFWWGGDLPNGDKLSGHFYGACEARCQPIMGFLLSGLAAPEPAPPFPSGDWTLPILYEDEWLIIVDKPAGLLSLPGRYKERQDSVTSRIREQYPDVSGGVAVHRLDMATSGVLILTRTPEMYRKMSLQFRYRKVSKTYEAIVQGVVAEESGEICLPIWSNPATRPVQQIDHTHGKRSVTQYKVLSSTSDTTRLKLIPVTGRTHQLRLHLSHPEGLNAPIIGDGLYGGRPAERLYLHAKAIFFQHPVTSRPIHIQSPVPF